MNTRESIIKKSVSIFAKEGYEGISIRSLAKRVGIAPSVLYHHFKSKDELLRHMFEYISHDLGVKRAKLSTEKTASALLKQRIAFQFDHAQEIVAILKFYLSYRNEFPFLESGFFPEKAYLHIEEVLTKGVERGEFASQNIREDAKVIAHAINGFILEYYPRTIKVGERQRLVDSIHLFIIRALRP